MQAIILCGGQGTRLRSVIGERQKTMTEIGEVPFLVKIINYLKKYKITNVIFAIGYKGTEVRKYFGENYFFGVEVNYAEEKVPLGTGGAIRNSLHFINDDYVYVLNGDTLFEADLNQLKNNFLTVNADMGIACKRIDDKRRFGTVKLEYNGDRTCGNIDIPVVTSFEEKVDVVNSKTEDTVINGGVYILKKSLIETIDEGKKVSLELDLVPKWLKEERLITAIVNDIDFDDIGTPESLNKFIEKQNMNDGID